MKNISNNSIAEKQMVLSKIKEITDQLTLINLYRLKYFAEGLLSNK